LPEKPNREFIGMPRAISSGVIVQLIRKRLEAGFPSLDLTGLPPGFPFSEKDLLTFEVPTFRQCLRKLSERYDQIVFTPEPTPRAASDDPVVVLPPPPPPPLPPPSPPPRRLLLVLEQAWKTHFSAAAREYKDTAYSTSLLPEIQNALDGWLQCLATEKLTGSGPWAKVELVTDKTKHQYGYINVIRIEGPDAPGIGIAIWLGQGAVRINDLRHRIGFFKNKVRPIHTLILLRSDGEAALTGDTGTEYEQAIKAGRDVRVWKYELKHFHTLIAFPRWLQAVQEEVAAAGVEGKSAFREYIAGLSEELLNWINQWRQPATAKVSLPT
jgi:hypothetical protein